ncbi:MAG: hypothetical protein V1701_01090 [Planctomycetota bacterium]
MKKSSLRFSLAILLAILSLGLGVKGCVIWEKVKVQDEAGSSGALRAPTGLVATAILSPILTVPTAPGRIDLTWTDNSDNEAGFRVERSDDGGITYSQIGLAPENNEIMDPQVVFKNDTIILADTYYYKVCSYNSAGNSAYIGPISATNTAPAKPSALTGTAKSYTQIDIVWQDNANNETGFKIERSSDGITYDTIAAIFSDDPLYRTTPTSITCTYTDAGLLPTTPYTYRIRAYSTNLGDSIPSDPVLVATLSLTDLAKTWGSSSNERANKIILGADASIYVCGYTSSGGAGSKDALIVKFDSSGKVLWQKTWGQVGDDEATSMLIDPDKNIYTCGLTSNFLCQEGGIFFCKYNSIGQKTYQRVWDGPNPDNAYSMARTTSGIYITGNTRSYGAGDSDMLVLKYSEDGSLTWARCWGTSFAETAYDSAVDANGNIYLAGDTYSVSNSDLALISLDTNGNLRWRRLWIDSLNERAQAIAVSTSGDVYVAGETNTVGVVGAKDVLVVRYNSSGTLIWQRRWGGSQNDIAESIAIDSASGNIYVCGTTESFSSAPTPFIIVYNSLGELQSQRIWESSLGGGVYDIATDAYSVFICGYTKKTLGVWNNVSGVSGGGIGTEFLTAFTRADAAVGGSLGIPIATLSGSITGVEGTVPSPSVTDAGLDDILLLRIRK